MTWLLQCWDIPAPDMELDGSETKQLGSLCWDVNIDKGIGKEDRNSQVKREGKAFSQG